MHSQMSACSVLRSIQCTHLLTRYSQNIRCAIPQLLGPLYRWEEHLYCFEHISANGKTYFLKI